MAAATGLGMQVVSGVCRIGMGDWRIRRIPGSKYGWVWGMFYPCGSGTLKTPNLTDHDIVILMTDGANCMRW